MKTMSKLEGRELKVINQNMETSDVREAEKEKQAGRTGRKPEQE